MKKLFVFGVAFIAFTSFTFSGNNDVSSAKSSPAVSVYKAQEMFGYFRIHHQTPKNVVLDWGITTPTGVSCFTIERSYDGEFFDVINQVACNNSVKFSWKDQGIFPGYIYYRIACNMNDGTIHYSTTEVIRVVQH